MKSPTPISFRIPGDVKSALEKAAAADSRSLSSLIQKVLTDWLKKGGHLKA
jgi:predicted HicB family RNase H-like nuclease